MDEIDDISDWHECNQPVCKRRQSMKQVFADIRTLQTLARKGRKKKMHIKYEGNCSVFPYLPACSLGSLSL